MTKKRRQFSVQSTPEYKEAVELINKAISSIEELERPLSQEESEFLSSTTEWRKRQVERSYTRLEEAS